MMKDGNGEEDGDGEGLSFGMLSRLISEGRAGEVPVKQIPEGTNVSYCSTGWIERIGRLATSDVATAGYGQRYRVGSMIKESLTCRNHNPVKQSCKQGLSHGNRPIH